MLIPRITNILSSWDSSDTILEASFSVLLQVVNSLLTSAARQTNKVIDLSQPHKDKTMIVPSFIKDSQKSKKRSHQHYKAVLSNSASSPEEILAARNSFLSERANFRKLSRQYLAAKSVERDSKLYDVLSSTSTVKSIKRVKSSANSKISELNVDGCMYYGDNVGDNLPLMRKLGVDIAIYDRYNCNL